MQAKLLIATAAALAVLGASAADAASRKYKRHKVYRAHPPIVVYGGAPAWHYGFGAYRAYPGHPPNRPAWTRGTECYTDEGYGRFSPCDMSRGRF
jgi:hypothetical protein